ncbi:MAG: imidazole glycerol phosphate synthase subunit HisH [Bacteroidales bacterium]|jgi:glutamine amidotransferase|nr:imidazole glycerol phosphate synthase subunit HisH [Bacteroidales bacterium]
MTGIVDYKAGNLKSVQNALKRLNADFITSNKACELAKCNRIIIPGVGGAGWAMENLKKNNLVEVIRNLKCPVLGICLGLQILCSYSEEDDTEGIGIFPNMVSRIPSSEEIKVPDTGWNTVYDLNTPLFDGIEENSFFYFVHSYSAEINGYTCAKTDYGIKFSAALKEDNFTGCQFHPEKSGRIGQKFLQNFLTKEI